MNGKRTKLMAILMLLVCVGITQARIKLVALPERAATVIRLDNVLGLHRPGLSWLRCLSVLRP
jgi:hypothetical protein